jgi:hypothetical protein
VLSLHQSFWVQRGGATVHQLQCCQRCFLFSAGEQAARASLLLNVKWFLALLAEQGGGAEPECIWDVTSLVLSLVTSVVPLALSQ